MIYNIIYYIVIVYIRMFFSTFDNSTTGFDSLPSQGILVVCGLRALALVPLGPVLAEDGILWHKPCKSPWLVALEMPSEIGQSQS